MAFIKFFSKPTPESTPKPPRKCPLCGQGVVDPKSHHCDHCGEYVPPYKPRQATPKPLVKACPKCGLILPANNYCEHCEEYVANPRMVEDIY